EGSATTHVGGNAFTFGLVSDGDSLTERFSGIRAGFERKNIGTERLGLRFQFDSFHEMWNDATLRAAAFSSSDPLIYRTLQFFMPEATPMLAKPLELDFGVRFSRYRLSTPASRTESSNAVVTTLRYHPRWGSAEDPKHPDAPEHDLDADYSFQAATRLFD